jgi:hypothetical protein
MCGPLNVSPNSAAVPLAAGRHRPVNFWNNPAPPGWKR